MRNSVGNIIPNQFIIVVGNDVYFQSYDKIIAKKSKGKVSLDRKLWDSGKTIGRYRCVFLQEQRDETLKKIKSKSYKLENLNK